MSIQVTPIPRLTSFAAPALTLGTANAAGAAETTIATDSTLLVFDTTVPAAVGPAATGSATVAVRRDHVHAGLTYPLGGNLNLASHLLVGNGGSTGIAISANGEVTNTAQPAVLAFSSVTDNNATGNGTAYTVDFNTQVFDQNDDFDNDTFTAPVTGRYRVSAYFRTDGNVAAATYTLDIVTTNRTYRLNDSLAAQDTLGRTISALVDMDAGGDTLTIVLTINGQGGDVSDVIGSASALFTSISVELVV